MHAKRQWKLLDGRVMQGVHLVLYCHLACVQAHRAIAVLNAARCLCLMPELG